MMGKQQACNLFGIELLHAARFLKIISQLSGPFLAVYCV